MKKCIHCGEPWPLKETPDFSAVCEKCQYCLHSCVNCRLYDSKGERCTSRSTEDIIDREGKNWCEEFIFAGKHDQTDTNSNRDEARKKLEQLFGD